MEAEIRVETKNGAQKIKATVTHGCKSYIKFFKDVADACFWVHKTEDALKQGLNPREVEGAWA